MSLENEIFKEFNAGGCALNGVEIIYLPSVGSTNTYAKQLLNSGKKNTFLVIADEQTAGRGRSGKSFFSPCGTGVYMSLVIHPEASLQNAVSLTTRVSVAVSRAIETVTGKTSGIKWVNDIYVGGVKVCGILTEAVSDFSLGVTHSAVIGVGVNVSTALFPAELQGVAGSLGVSPIFRARLAAEITKNIILICADLHDLNYLDEYRTRSIVIGKTIDYYENGQKNTALAVGVDSKGGLIVELPDGGRTTLSSGEISVRFNSSVSR